MPYFGGKSQAGVFQRIINLIPPHSVFVEPFFGSGAITRLKRPAEKTIGIDRVTPDPALIAGVDFRIGCGIGFLETYSFEGHEVVYCDPPYLHSTRRSKTRYRFEMSDADHAGFLRAILRLPCRVLVSGYPSKLYDDALAGWNRDEFQVMTRGHTWATEVLWFNYPRPSKLHDLSKVGADFRERWRITKKRRRWAARLDRMPVLEREALFSALVDVMARDANAAAGAVSGAASSLKNPFRTRSKSAFNKQRLGAQARTTPPGPKGIRLALAGSGSKQCPRV